MSTVFDLSHLKEQLHLCQLGVSVSGGIYDVRVFDAWFSMRSLLTKGLQAEGLILLLFFPNKKYTECFSFFFT